jgi:beta-galactosidase
MSILFFYRKLFSRTILLFTLLLCIHLESDSQKIYKLNIDVPEKKIISGHLKLGGSNIEGKTIEVNSYYMVMNGKPVLPVTGEFHFSRYPDKYWEESIRKMKAGGVDLIATYVFWNIHEETEGVFNWDGDNNLRKFLELCEKYDFNVIVRIGPFCHGEIRNGGLPDWLLGKPLTIRSNDPYYLFYVDRLYQQISKQLEGLLFKDGGPVIGIQLENEFQHSASPWGLTYPGQPYDYTSAEMDRAVIQEGVGVAQADNPYAELGNEHMRVLMSVARKAGMEVPVYTATGWGYAAVIENETLPVTSAYPYPTWAPNQPSTLYLYTDLQKNPDYSPVRYQNEQYPYFAAEIGGGIMNTYDRRPLIPYNSVDPLINRFLGSGTNGIGYYMYHGGSTPRGEKNWFSDMAVGSPIISYDFQAPVGEFGQIRPSFHRLKLLHFFLNAFGDILAPMQTILPDGYNQITPDDNTSLRYTVRAKGESGFIFMNNFQDHLQRNNMENIQFSLHTGTGDLLVPESGGVTLKKDEHAILPFNFEMGGIILNYSTAQLLTSGENGKSFYFVFYAIPGIKPEFSVQKANGIVIQRKENCQVSENSKRILVNCSESVPSEFILKQKDGKTITVLTIDKPFALKSYVVNINGKRYILFSDALILQRGDLFDLQSTGQNTFNLSVYPKMESTPKLSWGTITRQNEAHSIMSTFRIELPAQKVDLPIRTIQQNKIQLTLPAAKPSGINDLYLVIDYTGDTGMGFLNGELVADNFYNGTKWTVGLKKFMDLPGQKEMVFYFRPLYQNAPYFQDFETASIPVFSDNQPNLEIKSVEVIPEYQTTISFIK